jgi:7-cyano-7-deazaguanine reductase
MSDSFSILESFPNRTADRQYEVEFTCPEFTCLCPKSGFPDFATIFIRYVPDQKCVELKSLKLYINSFRNLGVFHEDVTNTIMSDIIHLLDPWFIEVCGDFNIRGNIHTKVIARHGKGKFEKLSTQLRESPFTGGRTRKDGTSFPAEV